MSKGVVVLWLELAANRSVPDWSHGTDGRRVGPCLNEDQVEQSNLEGE